MQRRSRQAFECGTPLLTLFWTHLFLRALSSSQASSHPSRRVPQCKAKNSSFRVCAPEGRFGRGQKQCDSHSCDRCRTCRLLMLRAGCLADPPAVTTPLMLPLKPWTAQGHSPWPSLPHPPSRLVSVLAHPSPAPQVCEDPRGFHRGLPLQDGRFVTFPPSECAPGGDRQILARGGRSDADASGADSHHRDRKRSGTNGMRERRAPKQNATRKQRAPQGGARAMPTKRRGDPTKRRARS